MALDTAAQHVDHRIFLSGAGLDLIDRVSVLHGKALVDAAHDLTVALRHILACFFAVFPDSSRDIAGRVKFRRRRIHEALQRLRLLRHLFHLAEAVFPSLPDPLTAALLNHPQSDDIFQEGDPSSIAGLVCDIQSGRGFVDQGLIQFCPE